MLQDDVAKCSIDAVILPFIVAVSHK